SVATVTLYLSWSPESSATPLSCPVPGRAPSKRNLQAMDSAGTRNVARPACRVSWAEGAALPPAAGSPRQGDGTHGTTGTLAATGGGLPARLGSVRFRRMSLLPPPRSAAAPGVHAGLSRCPQMCPRPRVRLLHPRHGPPRLRQPDRRPRLRP